MESNQTQANQTLDTRGINCPLPIVRTRKALNSLHSGDTLKVLATDKESLKNMVSFCSQTGNALLSSQQVDSDYEFIIRKA